MPLPTLKLPRRLLAVLLALVLFAPASSFGRILYSCGMTGRVTSGACCCARAKAKAAEAERAAGLGDRVKVEPSGCCRADDNRRAAVPGSLSAFEVQVLAAAPLALLPMTMPSGSVSEQQSWVARSIRGPPRARLFAANCSLLI